MKIFIQINAILFLVYGLGFMFFPEPLSFYVTDARPTTESGLIDMRATYGGIAVGFAILLNLIRKNSALIPLGVKAILLIVGGMALGRIVGMIQDGSPNTIMYVYLLLEVVVVSIGLLLLSRTDKILKPLNGK